MATKIAVKDLYKIFGPNPDAARRMLDEGKNKDEIFAETGMTVGVQDASFDIEEGEIFVVMGLSGSGKSTLVRMLNRLIEPTSGSIEIDGNDITKYSRRELIALRRRDMSMVFQSFALLPHLRVWENAAFGLDVAGASKDEKYDRAISALDAVGLAPNANSFPSELSGGMQQRVGLARALANEPTILLMDEAFSALDPLIRTEMQDELLRLQAEQQRTVVFISHDLDEAIRIGDRIAIMEGGMVVQVGRPDEIIKNPANEYVRSFFKGVDLSKVLTAADIARREQVTVVKPATGGVHTALTQLRQRDREFAIIHDKQKHYIGAVSVDSLLAAEKAAANGEASLDGALLTDVEPLPANTGFDDVLSRVASSRYPIPVVDENGTYRGAVSKTALLETLDRTR